MSSENNYRTASEMNEIVADLPAFKGLKFDDSLCSCGMHLAVKGQGICTICISQQDMQIAELNQFDTELSDAINGMGDTWSW